MIRAQGQNIIAGTLERPARLQLRAKTNDEQNDGFSRQAKQVQSLLSLLDGMPDAIPPPGLVQRTLRRINTGPATGGALES
jgi:hypothetical protein